MTTVVSDTVLMSIIGRYKDLRGALLPILHDVHDQLGYIPAESVPLIAGELNLSRAEVHGAISFYHDFRREPPAKPVVSLCRAEACQARGVDEIAPLFDEDDRIEVRTVYCLGLCATGPNAMVGDLLYSRLDEERSRSLIDRIASS